AARDRQERHHGHAHQQAQPGEPVGDPLPGDPLLAFLLEIAELAAAGSAYPFADRERHPGRTRDRRGVAAHACYAHHVAYPPELWILGLQEVIVRELGY